MCKHLGWEATLALFLNLNFYDSLTTHLRLIYDSFGGHYRTILEPFSRDGGVSRGDRDRFSLHLKPR